MPDRELNQERFVNVHNDDEISPEEAYQIEMYERRQQEKLEFENLKDGNN